MKIIGACVLARPALSHTPTQIISNRRKLLQSRLQIFNDTGSQDIGCCKRIRAFKALIAQPEEVKTDLVTLEQLIIAEGVEALAFLAFVTVLGVIAGHKVIEMCTSKWIRFQREILVGP